MCVRPPRKLIEAGLLQQVRQGVYDGVIPGIATIRVIVVRDLPLEEQNSLLHLFSGSARAPRYAREHYHPQSTESNTLLYRLFKCPAQC